MNSVAEALNTLISAVNIAHNKGGVYSLEESHYIYLAISYLNSLQNQAKSAQEQQANIPQQAPQAPQGPYMGAENEEDYSEY
jgi:hypothetical protein